jgi:5-methylcytosine-specific restriction endonuclease McrA
VKRCSKCGVEKELEEFSNLSRNKDGKQPKCKQCDRQYIESNRDRIALQRKDYRNRNKDKIKEGGVEYYALHRDEILEKRRNISNKTLVTTRRRGYIKHREERLERSKAYQQSPQGKTILAGCRHKRRSAIKSIECTLTLSQWNKIIELQGNKCVLCGKSFTKKNPATRDHIIPLIPYNGPFTMENTQALHRSCNSRKRNKLDKSNIVVWISALAQEG